MVISLTLRPCVPFVCAHLFISSVEVVSLALSLEAAKFKDLPSCLNYFVSCYFLWYMDWCSWCFYLCKKWTSFLLNAQSLYGGISLSNKYKSQKAYQLPSQKGFFSFCGLVLILHQQPSTPRGLLPGADTNLCSSFFKRVISLHSWMSSILHRHDGTGDTHSHLLAPHMLHVSQSAASHTLYRPRKWNTNRESWILPFFSWSRNRCDVSAFSICLHHHCFLSKPFKSVVYETFCAFLTWHLS